MRIFDNPYRPRSGALSAVDAPVNRGQSATPGEKPGLDGATGYAVIADWNIRGLRTVKGKPWSYSTLRTVLTNPRVAGLASHSRPWGPEQREKGLWEIVKRADGSEVVGLWPAILERDRWQAVCDWFAATSAKRGGGTARNTRRYLLSGLLRCGKCGAKMHGQHRKGYPAIYACAGVSKGGCGQLSRVAPKIEEYVVQAALAKYERELAARRAAAGPAEPLTWPGAADLDRIERKLSEAFDAWKADQIKGGEYFYAPARAAVRRTGRATLATAAGGSWSPGGGPARPSPTTGPIGARSLSRSWAEQHADQRPADAGLPDPHDEPDQHVWEYAKASDPDVPPLPERIGRALSERVRWQGCLAAARASSTTPPAPDPATAGTGPPGS
jgi:hypothetical protein